MKFSVEGWVYTSGCGGSGCCGLLAATVRSGPDTSTVTLLGQTYGGKADFSGGVEVPVTFVAGTPRVEVEMFGAAALAASTWWMPPGRIRFERTNRTRSSSPAWGSGRSRFPFCGAGARSRRSTVSARAARRDSRHHPKFSPGPVRASRFPAPYNAPRRSSVMESDASDGRHVDRDRDRLAHGTRRTGGGRQPQLHRALHAPPPVRA